ncbi:alpha/beta hydrolase [Candidatus Wolfebacteria bacterium]|nr:alpha/beta hydrolase [Candidatus Wolfebacteria bacterium]
MKKQIFVIHGGDTFITYEKYLSFLKNLQFDFERFKISKNNWKTNLPENLGDDFEVIAPRMPNSNNAKYLEWKIWFEKIIPYLEPEIILIGHSLGGTFLVKYLSENDFPKKIKALFLIAAPYEGNPEESLCDFKPAKNLTKLQNQTNNIFIYHSQDDQAAPFSDAKKYKKALPEAELIMFKNREHFNQTDFPELVDKIKEIYN